MDAERYAQVKTIVHHALSLEMRERATYLSAACDGDASLRAEVESLLGQDGETPAILGTGALAASVAAVMHRQLPASIGPYVPVEVLGEGGMGIVYRAEQTAPIQRVVALKVIRSEVASDRLVARFESERRTLARMDHPHIARILDAGASADGPYFAMDLVHGRPITEYAASHALPVRARLDLFLQVCDAVQHAHRKGVVHRDLKPSNLLVTEHDGRPLVKVIDFGIAKVIEAIPGDAPLTRAGLAIGTPDYMSPEQAGIIPDADVDTRTDVFALGVVLYELLAGRRPRSFATGSPAEFQRLLVADPVTRPSAAAREANATAVVPWTIHGDLDTIALKAIDVDPDRRYQSVEQLADDVRRHLAGLPVRARPATWFYRSGKFVHRHRTAVALAVVALVAVAGLTGYYTVRVARERDRARAEARKAEQVSTFLTALFESADPDMAHGREVSAKDLLARGAQRIAGELSAEPVLQGTMMRVIGGVYQNLGAYDEASPLLEGAVERHEGAAGSELELATSLADLASLAFDRGEFERSRSLLLRSLDLRRSRLAPPHPALVRTLEDLGRIDIEFNEFSSAEARLTEAVAMGRQLPADSDDAGALGAALMSLGRLRLLQGRYGEAQAIAREALDERRRVYGDAHSSVGAALDAIAEALRRDGKPAEAESIFREAVAHATGVLGEGHPTVTARMANLANALHNQGKYEEALQMQEQVLARHRAKLGPTHPMVASTLNNMLTSYHGLGRWADAERVGREALAIHVGNLGEDNDAVATVLNNLAHVVAERGEWDEAVRLQRRALAIDTKVQGSDHRTVAFDRAMVGTYLLEGGRVEEAGVLLREADAAMRRLVGPDHRQTAGVSYRLGMYLAAAGEFEKGEAVARDVLRIRTALLPPGHFETGLAETLLGEMLAGLGRDAEAEALLVHGFDLVKGQRPTRHRRDARRRLVEFYTSRGMADRAAAVP